MVVVVVVVVVVLVVGVVVGVVVVVGTRQSALNMASRLTVRSINHNGSALKELSCRM